MMTEQRGFTIIELMVTVAVIGVLIAIAVPSFQDLIRKRQSIAAAELVYEKMAEARSESLKRSKDITMSFQDGEDAWALGYTDDPASGCEANAANCEITDFNNDGTNVAVATASGHADAPGINLTASTSPVVFDWVQGTVDATNITLAHPDGGYELQVRLSTVGRAAICSNGTNKVTGYPACVNN